MWKFFTNKGVEKTTTDPTPAGLITSFAGASAPSGWLLCQGQELLRASYPALDNAIGITYGQYTNGSGAAGTTHLRLPDLRGRTPVGMYAGAGDRTDNNGQLAGTGAVTGSTMSSLPLGQWSGAEDLILTAAQSALPAHNHPRSSDGQNKATVTGTHGPHATGNTWHTHTTRYVNQGASVSGNPNNWVRHADGNNSSGEYINTAPSGIGATVGHSTTNIYIVDAAATNASSAHANIQQFLVTNFIIKT